MAVSKYEKFDPKLPCQTVELPNGFKIQTPSCMVIAGPSQGDL